MHDLVVIGAGPAGLSAAIAGLRADFDVVVLEKGALVNTIVGYPLETQFFSTADNLTIADVPWPAVHPHPTRLEALNYYRAVVAATELPVRCYEPALAVERQPDGTFIVRSQRRDGSTGRYPTRAVIYAYGSYDTPNRLKIPGEELPKVRHYYSEGHPFFRQQVAVVGGGNSAAEAALDLFYHGAHVTLVHIFDDFDPRVKPWVLADLRAWIAAGKIATRWETQVTAVTPHTLMLQRADGSSEELPNDWLFAMIGYRPNTTLLSDVGIAIGENLVPEHDPDTFETNIPGAFVAGVLTAGALPSRVFIENGRNHGPRIVAVLRERWGR